MDCASFESIRLKRFSFRSRVVVHGAGTVVCAVSRGRLVGVRWARAVREGGEGGASV